MKNLVITTVASLVAIYFLALLWLGVWHSVYEYDYDYTNDLNLLALGGLVTIFIVACTAGAVALTTTDGVNYDSEDST